jgi:hypothetical protein
MDQFEVTRFPEILFLKNHCAFQFGKTIGPTGSKVCCVEKSINFEAYD